MQELRLRNGINTIGNYTNENITAKTALSDDGVVNAKTLLKQRWKSWNKTSIETFLGFRELEAGRGYVITATSNTARATLPDAPDVQLKDLPAVVGDNFLALPLTGKITPDNARFSATQFKRVENTRWKSYTKGTSDIFQGFKTYIKGQGYFVKITEVYTIDDNEVSEESDVTFSPLSSVLPYILGVGVGIEGSRLANLDKVSRGLRFALYNRE